MWIISVINQDVFFVFWTTSLQHSVLPVSLPLIGSCSHHVCSPTSTSSLQQRLSAVCVFVLEPPLIRLSAAHIFTTERFPRGRLYSAPQEENSAAFLLSSLDVFFCFFFLLQKIFFYHISDIYSCNCTQKISVWYVFGTLYTSFF